MTPLDTLLSVSALTVAVMLVIGHTRAAGWIATILYALQGGLSRCYNAILSALALAPSLKRFRRP
jgi:hypothetical protein